MYRSLNFTSSAQAQRHLEFLRRHKVRTTIPYAYVRFSNEAITLKACLESLVDFVDRGILCYHQPLPGIAEDGSIAIAQEFVRQNPGFRLVQYPLPVIYHDHPFLAANLFRGDIDRYWLMDCYSNYALYHLEELARENGDYDNAWCLKIDADHIYSAKVFNYQRALVESKFYPWDMLLLTKFNVAFDRRGISDDVNTNVTTNNDIVSVTDSGKGAVVNIKANGVSGVVNVTDNEDAAVMNVVGNAEIANDGTININDSDIDDSDKFSHVACNNIPSNNYNLNNNSPSFSSNSFTPINTHQSLSNNANNVASTQ